MTLSKGFNLTILALLTAASVIWLLYFALIRPSDYATYKKFLAKSKEASTSSFAAAANQKRHNVRKDIWFAQEDNSRLHYRIESEGSLLTLVPKGDKIDIIENLEKIKCWMQDRLYVAGGSKDPMQQMRYFEANQGTYNYELQQFVAQAVSLSLHRLPGHMLPSQLIGNPAFLRGIASDVSFSISGKSPQFEARHFKATLNNRSDP